MGLDATDKISSDRGSEIWWRRVAAALIDSVLVVLLIELLLAIIGYKTLFLQGHVVHDTTARIVGILAAALYYPVVMTRTDGRTLGKLAMGIRVVRTDRHAMGLVRATLREVIIKVALFGTLASLPIEKGGVFTLLRLMGLLFVALDFLWPLWDGENRALHDMLAHTRVLRACEVPELRSVVNEKV
jgi:uncharacterized RDD family membrane protein YckC